MVPLGQEQVVRELEDDAAHDRDRQRPRGRAPSGHSRSFWPDLPEHVDERRGRGRSRPCRSCRAPRAGRPRGARSSGGWRRSASFSGVASAITSRSTSPRTILCLVPQRTALDVVALRVGVGHDDVGPAVDAAGALGMLHHGLRTDCGMAVLKAQGSRSPRPCGAGGLRRARSISGSPAASAACRTSGSRRGRCGPRPS